MIWGETIAVYCDLGFPVDLFTLDDATLGVLDGAGALDGVIKGKNLAPYVQEVSFSRGRPDELQALPAGTGSMTLNNNDRRFDPINSTSPYWDATNDRTGVEPRRQVIVTSDGYDLFNGMITDINIQYKPISPTASQEFSAVEFQIADDFAKLANTVTAYAYTPTEEVSSARVSGILDLAEVAYPLADRDIQTGTATLGGGATYDISAGTNILNYLQSVAQSETGFLYMSRDGKLTFTARLIPFPSGYAATFSDAGGATIPYTNLEIVYGTELFYNKIICQIEGGTAQVADDLGSQTTYGISTLNLSGLLLSTDSQADAMAKRLLTFYSKPFYRFNNLEISYNQLSAPQRATVSQLEIGDAISVTHTFVTGSPTTVTKAYLIEQIAHQITPSLHKMRLQLSSIPVLSEFTLDDSEKGVLDSFNALPA